VNIGDELTLAAESREWARLGGGVLQWWDASLSI
jgi:hypothetical protein